jgi:hypothetical protein
LRAFSSAAVARPSAEASSASASSARRPAASSSRRSSRSSPSRATSWSWAREDAARASSRSARTLASSAGSAPPRAAGSGLGEGRDEGGAPRRRGGLVDHLDAGGAEEVGARAADRRARRRGRRRRRFAAEGEAGGERLVHPRQGAQGRVGLTVEGTELGARRSLVLVRQRRRGGVHLVDRHRLLAGELVERGGGLPRAGGRRGESVERVVEEPQVLVHRGARDAARRLVRKRLEVEPRDLGPGLALGRADPELLLEADELLLALLGPGGRRGALGEADERAELLDQRVGLVGLEQVLVRARLQGPVLLEGLLGRLGAGEEQRDRLEPVVLLELLADEVPAHAGELDAEDDRLRGPVAREVETLLAVAGGASLEPDLLEGGGQPARERLVVLDEEDLLGHLAGPGGAA